MLDKAEQAQVHKLVRDVIGRLPPRPIKAHTIGTLTVNELVGAPTSPTPDTSDSSQRIANTAWVAKQGFATQTWVQSQSYLTALPAATLMLAGGTAITSGTQQPLQLAQAYEINTDGTVYGSRGGTSSAFTVAKAGIYLVLAHLDYPSNATGNRYTQVWRNGAAITTAAGGTIEDTRAAVNGLITEVHLSGIVDLAASDYLQLVGYQNSGASMTPTVGWLSLIKIA